MQRLRLLTLAALIGALVWLPGCDNPACVFGGNCFGGGVTGTLGTQAATVPNNNEWLTTAVPTVERFVPTGTPTVDTRTPLVVVFSESMSSSGMQTLFLLQDSNGAPSPSLASLLGDGRVLVLLPTTALTAGETYTLSYNAAAQVQDRNGQALVIPTDRVLTTFTVSATNAITPKLVFNWPGDNAIHQGGKGEVLAVFDRPLDPTTLDATTFHVQVNAADLATPIDPTTLSLAGGVTHDARVVRWRNVDPAGAPLALGLDAAVSIELSPTGHLLKDLAGNSVPHTVFDYHTLAFASPLSASITSDPTDAIGIDSISGPETLAVRVLLDGAQAGDRLGIYEIGTDPDPAQQNPKLICLARDVAITAPYTDFTLTAGELDLRATSSPLKARFKEGEVHFALTLRRGTAESPITLLDTDDTSAGEQAAILDTTPPTLLGLGPTGTNTSLYRSDMRDLVVSGRASEILRAATVTTVLGDNMGGIATPPAVVGSIAGGLFIARPVPLGTIDPSLMPLEFQLTIYDRALNHAGPLSSTFQQIGVVGPGNTDFTQITVHVYDAVTNAPISGATVATHEWLFGGVTGLGEQTTNAAGYALMQASINLGRNILSVRASGYEFFTFDGVTVDRVDILLHPLLSAGATVEGTVSSSAPQIALYTGLVADSRLADPLKLFEPVSSCTYDPTAQLFTCPYDPYPIESRRIGALSAFAIFTPPSVLLYTPAAFLKAATLEFPVGPAAPGEAVVNDQAHRHMLDQPGLDPEEAAIDAPAQLLTTTNFPLLAGDPQVSIEATSPGMPGTVVVGVGAAFTDALPPGAFAIRAAYPGSVDGIQDNPDDLLGEYVTAGAIDPDLKLRMQVVDPDGNVGGVRPRLSSNPVAEDPPAACALGVIPIDLDPFGEANTLYFTDVLPDSAGEPGLYRVVLTDIDGARWVIWTTDPPDAKGPEVQMHLPFFGPGISFPLAPGDLQCRISSFAWPAFDNTNFLWSDIEREFDLYSHSTLLTVTPP